MYFGYPGRVLYSCTASVLLASTPTKHYYCWWCTVIETKSLKMPPLSNFDNIAPSLQMYVHNSKTAFNVVMWHQFMVHLIIGGILLQSYSLVAKILFKMDEGGWWHCHTIITFAGFSASFFWCKITI